MEQSGDLYCPHKQICPLIFSLIYLAANGLLQECIWLVLSHVPHALGHLKTLPPKSLAEAGGGKPSRR